MIEGCGSNGCEYMTGGVAVVLGSIGANFGAGMTGGMAYLYDPTGATAPMMNMETLVTCPVSVAHWQEELKVLIARHVAETNSVKGADILQHWDEEKHNFVQVCPKEMLVHLPAPLARWSIPIGTGRIAGLRLRQKTWCRNGLPGGNAGRTLFPCW